MGRIENQLRRNIFDIIRNKAFEEARRKKSINNLFSHSFLILFCMCADHELNDFRYRRFRASSVRTKYLCYGKLLAIRLINAELNFHFFTSH